jgi:quinohemoprotein amine dehydrogenase
MQHIHNLQVTDEERRALVKYLADTQGLAPEETRGFRYALERRTDVVEAPAPTARSTMRAPFSLRGRST